MRAGGGGLIRASYTTRKTIFSRWSKMVYGAKNSRPPVPHSAMMPKNIPAKERKKKDLIYGNRFHSSDIGFENKRHNL